MASIKAQRALTPRFSLPLGSAVILDDKVVLSANPTAADTLDFLIPAGIRVTSIFLVSDDLDTNGSPTIVFGAGYRAVTTGSSLTPSATYFAAAGNTGLQSATRTQFTFKPITFEEDVYLQLTVATASATFAAGEVHAIIEGALVGIK